MRLVLRSAPAFARLEPPPHFDTQLHSVGTDLLPDPDFFYSHPAASPVAPKDV